MAIIRKRFSNREEWLEGRSNGIGASEAGAVIGVSPWQSPLELWRLKCGLGKPKDLSGNSAVEQGNRMEPALRALFSAMNPAYQVSYHQFDILRNSDFPFITATLDGELIDPNGRRGVLEIKTSSCSKKADWEKWNNKVPEQYAAQVLHQMLATGAEFVKLFAWLVNLDGDATIRTYHFERSDYEDDLKYLREKETEFWGYVQNRQRPPMILRM